MARPILDADFTVVRRSFDVVALINIDAGERLSLFGASGAGKTTCLEAVAGTAPLKLGHVYVGGELVNAAPPRGLGLSAERPIEPRRRGVSLVRQPTTLFPHMSVRGNITYGLETREQPGDRAFGQLLEEVGLTGLANAMPDSLSGGQRQRVCLARAIARPFLTLLLDEPFSAVDAASRMKLRDVAIAASTSREAAAVMVTHDLSEAQAFGHRLGLMDEGRLLQVGPTDEMVRQPATVRAAELVGYTTFLPHDCGKAWALHPDRFAEGAWPERGVVLEGTVRSVQPYGPRYACEMVPRERGWCHGERSVVRSSQEQVVVRVHVDRPPHVGECWDVTALQPPLVEVIPPPDDKEG